MKVILDVRGCPNCPFVDHLSHNDHHVCRAFKHQEIQAMMKVRSENPNHKLTATIGYPVRLPETAVPEEYDPRKANLEPPDWCPLRLARVDIVLTVGVGSLWPEDIGNLPEFLDKEK